MPATDDYLRKPQTMHRVFGASALLMLAVTAWMMWADYNDEWRTYQRKGIALQAERDRSRIAKITGDAEWTQRSNELKLQIEEVGKKLKDGKEQSKFDELTDKFDKANAAASDQLRDVKTQRQRRDVARADYNLAIRDNSPKRKAVLAAFEVAQGKVDQMEADYAEKKAAVDRAKAERVAFTAEQDRLQRELKALEGEKALLEATLRKTSPDPKTDWLVSAKRRLMHIPIIEGFNSPERVVQDWMPRLEIDLGGMAKVDRFDRCRTCHAMIDSLDTGTNPAFPHGDTKDGKYPHPYASHPRLDLYLTSTSPHPLPKFGCTVCHEGQGSGTSFVNASHTPNDTAQMAKWSKEHKWFDNHFWEHPMYPKRFQESGCIRCHVNVTELGVNAKYGATAPKVVKGYDLVKKYGCFGCHEISGFDGTKIVGPDLRLEPSTPAELEKIKNDPLQVAGKMRKVGPSLRHVGTKLEPGFVSAWTEEPKRFRPTTRMPQFFKLDNQIDGHAKAYNAVELTAMSHYLAVKSAVPAEGLLSPAADYKPDAERGRELFATRGCVVCHSHESVGDLKADFGPELSRVHAKLKPGKEGFDWLYTWIREPERHHPRTKMPHLYLDAEGPADKRVDPAADIAAFLLKLNGFPVDFKPTQTWAAPEVNDADLDGLLKHFLGKLLTPSQVTEVMKSGKYPIPKEKIKGDEIELIGAGDGALDPAEWKNRKLTYLGRKTISRYGCYGCHDIPNFDEGRPIGTGLQDWGKKDRSRLAFEHIHEYLHHHGVSDLGVRVENLTPDMAKRLKVEHPTGLRVSAPGKTAFKVDDVIVNVDGVVIGDVDQYREVLGRTVVGSEVSVTIVRDGAEQALKVKADGSLYDRVVDGTKRAEHHQFATPAEEEKERSAAFYYESLMHHGRPGFLWQKLRQPRSYDFKMVETKPYDDRLRMPRFPLTETEIDEIATFIVGLVAEPPATEYLYNPGGAAGARIRGEQLIQQFNCSGCHMFEPSKVRYAADVDGLTASDTSADYPEAIALLKKLRPIQNGLTGDKRVVKTAEGVKELPVIGFHGVVTGYPNPEDDPAEQEYIVESWDMLKVGEKEFFPTTKFIFPVANLDRIEPARGGVFADWLSKRLVEQKLAKEKSLATQMAPPPLYKQGAKVQTSWLFNFLRNPGRIRHTTVLRMPRFNMSDDEAQALASYFPAVDGTPFPYQPIEEREPAYLSVKDDAFKKKFPEKKHDYLAESWKMLNAPLCIKCHSVGGREVAISNPATDIRGPNLDLASDRLTPDWMLLWLYRPQWITPYTSMPSPLPPKQMGGADRYPEMFGDDGLHQTIGLRDSLVNYLKLMEREVAGSKRAAGPQPAAGAGGQ